MGGVGIVHPEGWAPARGYASGVIAGLLEPRAKVEIEATAVMGEG